MDINLDEIDKNGFRNGSMQSVDIVALGDSHTYGFNVSSSQSWPGYLGQKLGKNVYNYGVGGYGILQYHYLLNKSLGLKPDVIILGLYLANDLNDVCRLANNNQYWISRAEEFQVDLNVCLENQNNRNTSEHKPGKAITIRIKEWLQENVALVSVVSEFYAHFSLLNKIENKKIANGLVINSGDVKTVILDKRIRAHKTQMDQDSPAIRMANKLLKQFLIDAREISKSKGIHFGVMFIPSKERVFYEYLVNLDYNLSAEYVELVENEDALKLGISSLLDNLQMQYIDVLPAMEEALLSQGNIYPVKDDGHPVEAGYKIYGESAFKLYQKMAE